MMSESNVNEFEYLNLYNARYNNPAFCNIRDRIYAVFPASEAGVIIDSMLDVALWLCGGRAAGMAESLYSFVAYWRDMSKEQRAAVNEFLNRFVIRS